jgi:hypothetical protein
MNNEATCLPLSLYSRQRTALPAFALSIGPPGTGPVAFNWFRYISLVTTASHDGDNARRRPLSAGRQRQRQQHRRSPRARMRPEIMGTPRRGSPPRLVCVQLALLLGEWAGGPARARLACSARQAGGLAAWRAPNHSCLPPPPPAPSSVAVPDPHPAPSSHVAPHATPHTPASPPQPRRRASARPQLPRTAPTPTPTAGPSTAAATRPAPPPPAAAPPAAAVAAAVAATPRAATSWSPPSRAAGRRPTQSGKVRCGPPSQPPKRRPPSSLPATAPPLPPPPRPPRRQQRQQPAAAAAGPRGCWSRRPAPTAARSGSGSSTSRPDWMQT